MLVKSAALSTGVTLPYVETGNPSGLPVVFLHGYSDSWRSFELILPLLPASIRSMTLTQRGHGNASRPTTGYRPQDFAADVRAFLDFLVIEKAVIAGHSMGSCVAQRFALDYPARTLGLVLIGSFTTLRGIPATEELWSTVQGFTDPVDAAFVRDFQESSVGLPVPETFMRDAIQNSLQMPARVWKAALQGLMEADCSQEIDQIKTPTLILWGNKDAFFPRSEQDALAAAIEGSRLVVFPGVGHNPHWEEPERFVAHLSTFVDKLGE